MKTFRFWGFALFVVLTASVRAQDNPDPSLKGTQLSSPVASKPTSSKALWLKAEVVHADRHSIVVREQGNALAVHTFTYSPAIQTRMEAVADQGGFQSGDKVKILYKKGDTVALKIHGRPSKAS